MVSFPPCKINLGLRVISARPDGYHDIETCFYPVPWTDVLEIVPAAAFSFTATGRTIPGSERDNICLRAYRLLRDDFRLPPVAIYLHKVLPSGAGLGGASSDGVYTLKTLNSLFEIGLSSERLAAYALRLGSDCAFFLHDKPLLARGRGELFSEVEVSLRGYHLALVYPHIAISSAEAYAGITPRRPTASLAETLANGDPLAWRATLVNDFEETVFTTYPIIAEVKKKLYEAGALYASLSGSGSTVWGIFSDPQPLAPSFPKMLCHWAKPM